MGNLEETDLHSIQHVQVLVQDQAHFLNYTYFNCMKCSLSTKIQNQKKKNCEIQLNRKKA